MKNGIPIGDCVDLDARAQLKLGCPVSEPERYSPCVERGKECRYLLLGAGDSAEVTFTCFGDQPNWGEPSGEQCGYTCGNTQANTIIFESGSCTKRTPAVCDDGKMTMYPWPPNGLTLTTAMLRATLEACDASIAGNQVELYFTDGCPAQLSSVQTLPPEAVACLKQRLDGVRWTCATKLPCAGYSFRAL